MPLPDLVARLNQEFGHLRPARTLAGVQVRANRAGLLTEYTVGWTMDQLEHIVGWNHEGNNKTGGYQQHQIEKHWIAPGLLAARRVRGRGGRGLSSGTRWQILEADFDRFLQEHPYAYDWRRFAVGPWRARAEVIARRSPWRTLDDLRLFLGVEQLNFWWRYWRDIPHKRRHHTLGGSRHHLGQPLIHSDEFDAVRQRIAPALHRYAATGTRKTLRRRATWRRTCRTCRAVAIGRPDEPVSTRCAFCGTSIRRGSDPPLQERAA